ncbi:MAG TPA: bifunctional salicylyl-CoA 5-hydroxylase/oxidoreductase [Gemmatimonadaceae bacterium]|nr:bifunctional salicylyl-CoA 5-hydroxylase/oxidoreductase [Gemmatimonadaceae bacterium]
MKVVVVGGGPAGLYLAILLKNADPGFEVTVLERNPPDDTFGWGVVFSDATLENFRAADLETHQAITRHFAHWDDIDVHVRGTTITSRGHGFSGIARHTLLDLLRHRAVALGADLRFDCDVPAPEALGAMGLSDADVIVGADGINSMMRQHFTSEFQPTLDVRPARYIWLGTTVPFQAFTFLFQETEHGVYQAHCYRFDRDRSTFIVECDAESWRAAGFDGMDAAQTIAECEAMFAPWLCGHRLLYNGSHRASAPWTSFTRVSAERWAHGNVVLMGDAAHTAHFSVGSGTKLAMEDAIVLARELSGGGTLGEALGRYQAERKLEALRLQNAARNSMEWFENVRRYLRLEPLQFAYSLLTRSQRVGHENLRMRDATFVDRVERWVASEASSETQRVPPMFTPFSLRSMQLRNRVVVSPMDMYCAQDGTPNDFHLVHLGARALGGAGLVMTEMTCVSPDGRISLGCTGMYAEEHAEGWRRVTSFVHCWTPARICLQLGHSGRKGATKLMWEGMDEPLETGGWEVIGPSAERWGPNSPLPRAMDRGTMDVVRDEFVRSTGMAVECEFDMVELHCAHGYLLSSFLTPLSNRRTDEYGGPLANRLRYPVEVFRAMRAAWPAERPMSVRISATDWVEGGVDGAEAVEIARAFIDAGADIIHVSAGQTSPNARPVYGRMFQTPLSDRIRNDAGIPTIAVGNVTEADQVNAIIAAGRADLVALGRPHLHDPNWTLRAAATLGYADVSWPKQYHSGRDQLVRGIERGRE